MNTDFLYKLIRPALFSMDAEQAHYLTLDNLRRGQKLGLTSVMGKTRGTPRTVMGLTFANPVGLSAGLDKNGAYIDALAALGFGFLEIGTVTPRAQPGNPKPRMFRLPQAGALINRLGFNNDGVDSFVENVQRSRTYQEKTVLLGLNIGKNADTPIERAVDDYLICFEKVYPYASYVTINISSPNTKNLRQLQGAGELDALLGPLKKAQKKLADTFGRQVPMALKIAPDIDPSQIQSIADTLMTHRIEAVIATNTTLSRDAVQGMQHGEETGGLSGRPVFEKSNTVIAGLYDLLKGEIPIIGVGGIMRGEDALAKQNAGADLVQLYTGLIYRGPALVSECIQALRTERSKV